MFDAPVDAWYVWLGVAIVSTATLAVAVGLPTAAPPDAVAVADTIDGVATGPPGSMDAQPLDADDISLDRRTVGLRGPGGTTHASVAFGPITPATADERLERVTEGAVPSAVFEDASEFEGAIAEAQAADVGWRRAPDRLTVRRVTWEGIDVVLVG